LADCCSSTCGGSSPANKKACPENGLEYAEVSTRTIIHHLKHPWRWMDTAQRYYFCDDPSCDVVYFGDDDSVIHRDDLRTAVGIKENTASSLLCYCFGITKADADKEPSLRGYVIQKTKAGLCSCETSNPSGRCCLKDFPRSE